MSSDQKSSSKKRRLEDIHQKSSSKKSRLEDVQISLTDLPYDVLVKISSAVASSKCTEGFFNLLQVSKVFHTISKDACVLRSLSPKFIKFLRWLRGNPVAAARFDDCLSSGNLEAIYFSGLDAFFKNNDKELGLSRLDNAANLGHEKSKYLYGILLISLGGINWWKGFGLLSSLLIDSVSRSQKKLEMLRRSVLDSFWFRNAVLGELKSNYVRQDCFCDGKTSKFLALNGWTRHGWEMPASESCQICLWHYELEKFYEYQ